MRRCLTIILFVIFISGQYVDSASEEPPVVTVDSLGKVRGSRMNKTTLAGRDFLAFRGIPYAEPPVGKLRLSDPVPVKPWKGQVLDATKEGPACVQYASLYQTVTGVEDCLKLNIYTHDTKPDTLKPVMVWIHGGGFNVGSGNGETDFYGPGYLLDRDIVLVTINYRVAALGFFTLEDSEAPGNYGLLDQSLALRWVRDHIRNFGGDSSSVTIFGESAGGASVDYQVLSPRSKGLFDRAIAQSGAAQCPWALNQFAVAEYSRLLVKELNCDTSSSSKDVMECLRSKDAAEFANFSKNNVRVASVLPFLFTPRVDVERKDPFLPDHPTTLIKQKRFNHVPLITGANRNEGSLITALLLADNGKEWKKFETDPLHVIPYVTGTELYPGRRELAKKIHDQYFDADKPYDQQITAVEQMSGDNMFFHDIDKTARLYAKYSEQPTYYYYFEHKGEHSVCNFLSMGSDFDFGVCHGDDMFLLFSSAVFAIKSDSDLKMSKALLDLWTSFARDGKPTSKSANQWLPLTGDGQTRFMRIRSENQTMEEGPMPFHHRLAFWDSLQDPAKSEKDEL